MMPSSPEQRNAYKGGPPRAWLGLRLISPRGIVEDLQFSVDTGCPFPIVVSVGRITRFLFRTSPRLSTNFGIYQGGQVRVAVPALGFDQRILGYGSDPTIIAVQRSHPDFAGLVGL